MLKILTLSWGVKYFTLDLCLWLNSGLNNWTSVNVCSKFCTILTKIYHKNVEEALIMEGAFILDILL